MSLEHRKAGDVDFAHTLGERPGPPRKVTEGPPASLLARMRARLRASPWTTLAGRGFLLMLGLLVLAWIGRAATAATSPPSTASTNAGPDAGAASGPVLAQVAPAVPPTPPTATAPVTSVPSPSTPSPSHARATPEDPVYVNHASVEELRRLPGVGPKRAEAIVALRQRMGKFQRVEDLLRVKGIGRATLRKWRPLLRLDAPASADAGTPGANEQAIRAP